MSSFIDVGLAVSEHWGFENDIVRQLRGFFLHQTTAVAVVDRAGKVWRVV